MYRHDPGSYSHHWHDGAAFGWWHLLFLVALLAAITFFVLALLRMRHHEVPAAAAPVPGVDQALVELRLRYARGDIDRDDYLRRAVDLGDTKAAEVPPSTGPEA